MRTLAVTAILVVSLLPLRLSAQGTGCADTRYPDTLFTPNALVDSAHAIGDLAAFADPAKPMVFSVYFGEGDSVAHVRALDKNDGAAAVSLANYVRHAPPRELWAFRVRIAGGDTPALTVERAKYCPPVSHEGDAPFATKVTGTITSVAVEGRAMRAPPTRNPPPIESGAVTADAGSVVLVEALIGVDGHVIVGRVVQSTGNPQTDANMVHNMRSLKFDPAKLDGEPIPGVFRSRGESPRQ